MKYEKQYGDDAVKINGKWYYGQLSISQGDTYGIRLRFKRKSEWDFWKSVAEAANITPSLLATLMLKGQLKRYGCNFDKITYEYWTLKEVAKEFGFYTPTTFVQNKALQDAKQHMLKIVKERLRAQNRKTKIHKEWEKRQ